jgi:TPP-dependent 2-oxoacid decarboxylase
MDVQPASQVCLFPSSIRSPLTLFSLLASLFSLPFSLFLIVALFVKGCVHRRMAHYEATSQKLGIDRLFDRLSSYLKPNVVVLADVGTSLYSAAETLMPQGTTFIGQTFYGSIGYTMGATLGAAVAVDGKRQGLTSFFLFCLLLSLFLFSLPSLPEQYTQVSDFISSFLSLVVVLFIGDGAFQMTCQDLSTVIRERLQVTVFLLNNKGYTIERLISDQGYYNDISNWKYHQLPQVSPFFPVPPSFFLLHFSCLVTPLTSVSHSSQAFGGEEGKTTLSFECNTEGDLENALKKIEGVETKSEGNTASNKNNNALSFVEVYLDKLDGASALKDAGKYMAVKR